MLEGDKLKDLRHTYSDRNSALRTARSELNRLQRGSATLSYNLAKGRADLIPELSYSLRGIKGEIDDVVWYGGNVQHSLTADGGFTTSLELDYGLYQEPKDGAYTRVMAYYKDKATGKEASVVAGELKNPKPIRRVYNSKEAAMVAANREWIKLQSRQP